MFEPKYPHVEVKLIGKDGNAFAILGAAQKAARKANLSKEEIDAYMVEAMSGDYDNLLQITMKWFNVS